MLNINDATKTTFLTDSTHKELMIHSDSMTGNYRNRYDGYPDLCVGFNGTLDPGYATILEGFYKDGTSTRSSDWAELIDFTDVWAFGYLCLSFVLKVSPYSYVEQQPSTVEIKLAVGQQGNWTFRTVSVTSAEYSSDIRVMFYVPTTAVTHGTVFFDMDVIVPSTETSSFVGVVYYNKTIVHVGNDPSLFPYEYKVYNADDVDIEGLPEINITNDNLISESFSLNESLCSEHNIKFGLCESSYCQFTVSDADVDFKNRVIRPSISAKLSESSVLIHSLLKNINLYASDGTQSKYRPYPSNSSIFGGVLEDLDFTYNFPSTVCCQISDAAKNYLSRYKFLRITFVIQLDVVEQTGIYPENIIFGTESQVIYPNGDISENQWTLVRINGAYSEFGGCNQILPFKDIVDKYTTISLNVPIDYDDYFSQYSSLWHNHGKLYNLAYYNNHGTIRYKFIDANNKPYDSDSGHILLNKVIKNVQVNFVDSVDEVVPAYDPDDAIEYHGQTIQNYLDSQMESIPLGVYKVTSVKKNHVNDILKLEVTAYDGLTVLEQNAADWYTQYMFGITTDDQEGTLHYLEYARQIFSTYYNFAKSVGLEKDEYYEDEQIFRQSYNQSSEVSSVKMTWADYGSAGDISPGGYINYVEINITDIDPTKLYKVSADTLSIEYLKKRNEIPKSYYMNVDSLARGLCSSNVLIRETLSNGKENKFCVENNEYFMISPNCSSFKIYVASRYHWNRNAYTQLIATETVLGGYVTVYKSSSAPNLPNGHLRLLYYNWGTGEIFDCDSSITGRDVVRSLLEINGCFFRLNRYTDKPEFIYCTKAALYPSDTLYPADDLYPRVGTDYTIDMSKYQSFIQEDYTVQKYGKIQIRKNITSNQTKSIVEWEYTGDDSYENVYAIDDNIFYCNEAMKYDYDGMPEVSEMLANMWMRISNMDYVPSTLTCIGMPWIECGDRITCLTKTGGAESFIFHRTLKGIQSLTDTFESEGDEYTEAINDYGYKEWEGN